MRKQQQQHRPTGSAAWNDEHSLLIKKKEGPLFVVVVVDPRVLQLQAAGVLTGRSSEMAPYATTSGLIQGPVKVLL